MKKKDKIIFVGLVSFLIIFVYFGFVWLPSKQYLYETEHLIVDKFTEVRGFHSVNTVYCVMLDNNETICGYERNVWLDIDVGNDTYNKTHWGFDWNR